MDKYKIGYLDGLNKAVDTIETIINDIVWAVSNYYPKSLAAAWPTLRIRLLELYTARSMIREKIVVHKQDMTYDKEEEEIKKLEEIVKIRCQHLGETNSNG